MQLRVVRTTSGAGRMRDLGCFPLYNALLPLAT